MKKTLLAAALLVATFTSAQAEILEARKGSLLWSAFTCSAYASNFKDDNYKEQNRLINFGLKVANEFYEALRNDKVTEEEARTEVPSIVLMSLSGPSDDFRSGVIYQWAVSEAYEEVGDRLDDEWVWKRLYREANCKHLGR